MTDMAQTAGGIIPKCSNIQKIRRSTRKRKTSDRLEDHDDRHNMKRRPTKSSSTRPRGPSPPPMAPIRPSRTPSVHHPCSPPQLPQRDPTTPPMAPIQPPADMGQQWLSIEQGKIRRSTRKRKTPDRLEDHDDRHKQKRRPTQSSSTRPRAPSPSPMSPIKQSRTPSVHHPCSPPQLPQRDPTAPPMASIQPPADMGHQCLSVEQEKIRRSTRKRKTLGRLGNHNDRHKQKRRPTQRSSIRSRAPSSPPMAPIRPSRTPSVATEPPMPLTPPGSPPQLLPRDPTPPPMAPVQPPADIRQEWLSKEQEIAKSNYSKVNTIIMSTTAEDNDDILDMEGQKHEKINIGEDKEYKCKDWTKCAQEKDVNKANKLLDNDNLPDPEDLQLVFDNFIDDSECKELLKVICRKIENRLMETNESIENVKGCLKHGDTMQKIIFVMETRSESTKIDCQYTFHVKQEHNEQVNEKEMTIEFNDTFHKANECLRNNSPGLMDSHSNLTGTSLSMVKCREQDPEHTICIVLYVEAKGYVPVGEDLLPSHLEYKDTVFKTVVRECQFARATAGPTDKHEDLKIGCRIESSKVLEGGTLGGFIDHPDHGLCAITCAHVLLTVQEFEQIHKGQMNVTSLTTTQCFQPMQPYECGEVCDVKLFKGNKDKGGMDIAFVKVDESRKPKTPSFPDMLSPFIDDLLPQKLEYDPRSVLQNFGQIKANSPVFKYGSKTKLTSGTFKCFGSSGVFYVDGHFYPEGRHQYKRVNYKLNDQIQILDDNGKFSDSGDSGAMVFHANEKKELMALGIINGRCEKLGTTFVTPIWNILNEIKIQRPYQLAVPRSARTIIEELKHSALSISKNCDELTRVLNH